MKVLYLHTGHDDFLNLCTFHGLRSLLGEHCVDIPRFEQTYQTYSKEKISKHKGGGFTVYGLLPELPQLTQRRQQWQQEIEQYDLIVIANIAGLWRTAFKLKRRFPGKKIAILDGWDSTAIFPFESIIRNIKNQPAAFFHSFRDFIYFKREKVPAEAMGALHKYFPGALADFSNFLPKTKPISFSIPEEKITKITAAIKEKPFPLQIIDKELSARVDAVFNPLGSDQRYFDQEADYFRDLQISKFGITGKRAGWDCFRHYEMAANGCVLCFKYLEAKPPGCAPHGLDASNCIGYNTVDELFATTEGISETQYDELLRNNYKWIDRNTTLKKAEYLVDACFD